MTYVFCSRPADYRLILHQLARKDSNLDTQDQNLVSCRWTTGQTVPLSVRIPAKYHARTLLHHKADAATVFSFSNANYLGVTDSEWQLSPRSAKPSQAQIKAKPIRGTSSFGAQADSNRDPAWLVYPLAFRPSLSTNAPYQRNRLS